MRVRRKRPQDLVLFALLAALCFPACWPLSCFSGCLVHSTPPPPPQPGSATYQLACDTAIGTVKTWVTYTVLATAEPVGPGATVEYDITAPVAQVDTGVTTTFEKSVEFFDVPAGLTVLSVQAAQGSTADFSSAVATTDGGTIAYTLTGSFTFDKTQRPVPPIQVKAIVTSTPGATIVWMPPVEVIGQANAGFFGDQTTTCAFPDAGPIWTSHVQ